MVNKLEKKKYKGKHSIKRSEKQMPTKYAMRNYKIYTLEEKRKKINNENPTLHYRSITQVSPWSINHNNLRSHGKKKQLNSQVID